MSWMDGIAHRARALFRGDAYRRELEEEVRFHMSLDELQGQHEGRGQTDARRYARRRFGNETYYREETRRMTGFELLDDIRGDLRFAWRTMVRAPGFATIAILTLAIGIGGTTAIFSAVDAMLLRPLPFEKPERLLQVSLASDDKKGERPTMHVWSFPKYRVLRDEQRVFESLGLYTDFQVTITGEQGAERIRAEEATAAYFQTLRVRPMIGSGFLPQDDASPGAAPRTILSHALWTRRFNADSSVLGRTILLGGKPHVVVGVMGRGFTGMSGRAELWTPVMMRPAEYLNEPWSLEFYLIGRVRDGVTIEAAKAAMPVLGAAVSKATPSSPSANGTTAPWSAAAEELNAVRVDPSIRRSLLVLFGAVGFVLLIACANLAGLLLGRASARRREIGVRLAIGAGRGRLVRQLVTESVMLAAVGGLAGVALAWISLRLISTTTALSVLRNPDFSGIGAVSYSSIAIDTTALGFAALATLITGIAFGLVPAFQATRPMVSMALKEGGAGSRGTGKHGSRARTLLTVGEVAMAMTLLAGSALMVRSLSRLLSIDPGFTSERTLTLRLSVPAEGFSRDSLPGFYSRVLESMRALPGVTGAALVDCAPATAGCNQTIARFPEGTTSGSNKEPTVGIHWMTPEWASLVGVQLKTGRMLDATDREGAPRAVLVNETLARTVWPGQNPIGKPIAVFQGGFDKGATVVGVVSDVRFGRLDTLAAPDVYLSYNQSPRRGMMVFLRTNIDPMSVAPSAREALRRIAPDMPTYDVRTMTSRVRETLGLRSLTAGLLVAFGGVSLALAMIGIYGVLSFGVTQRTAEFGIRLALGAESRDVLWLVMRQGIGVALVGALLGVVGGLAATKYLATMLYEVTPADPLTYVGTVVALVGCAALASWIPAARATKVSPTEALRRG